MYMSRRSFVKMSGAGSLAIASNEFLIPGEAKKVTVKILNPFKKIPVSLIIDDSTCLVNMAYYGIPQFAEVFPGQYKQDWRKLPREIPDTFVKEFAEWSIENGVKGKYSIVPYPACTGWVSRFIPGWTERELKNSLDLIREVILPNWDIHPEMISHTRVIDIKTGHPFPYATPDYMENWEWSQKKSVDELAAYQSYALRILKEAGLPCEGLTTPGSYGIRNQDNLALSTMEAVREVYGGEISHYFRDMFTKKGEHVVPKVLYPSGLDGSDPKCVVSIYGCAGDWFGGWDGLVAGDVNRFITEDLQSGRMVEVIDNGEPAIMVCHWPGIYFNGDKVGFNILKEIKKRLDQKYDDLIWMKLSEIARYWAAKELTDLSIQKNKLLVKAPFAAKGFTVQIDTVLRNPRIIEKGEEKPVIRIKDKRALSPGTYFIDKNESVLCFDLVKGLNELLIS